MVVAATLLVGLLVYGVLTVGESTTLDDAVAKGEKPAAPSRTLPKLGGGEASIAAYRGKPVVVNFWASWCGPCKEEAPALERAQKQLTKVGGTVVGVTVNDSSPDSQAFVKENKVSYPSLRDVDDELGKDFGRTGVPETFVIDSDGRVVALSRGQVDDEFFKQALPEVMGS